MSIAERRSVYVIARLIEPGRPSSSEDMDVAGVYEIGVDRDLEEDRVASAALDAFHRSEPVTILDDFSFEVRDEAWTELFEPDDVDGYALSNRAHFRDKLACDPDYVPVTTEVKRSQGPKP